MKKEELKMEATESQIIKLGLITVFGLLLSMVIQSQRPEHGPISDKKYWFPDKYIFMSMD